MRKAKKNYRLVKCCGTCQWIGTARGHKGKSILDPDFVCHADKDRPGMFDDVGTIISNSVHEKWVDNHIVDLCGLCDWWEER